MADVIITGNVQTTTSSGSTTPAVTITSSVSSGVTMQGTVSTGGIGPTGATGATGAQGIQGTQGVPGADGSNGVGVPTGGTTGQILKKNSNTDYDTAWANESAGTVTEAFVIAMGVSL